MMIPRLLLLLLLLPLGTNAQSPRLRHTKRNLTDTIFYDAYGLLADRSNALTYSLTRNGTDGKYAITDYFMGSNKVERAGYQTSLDSSSWEGEFSRYSQGGNMIAKGLYSSNKKTGPWTHFYDSSATSVWYTCSYVDDKKDGDLKSYYRSGKLKRQESHKYCTDTIYYKERRERKFYTKQKDSILRGQCFDEMGNEIAFTAFEVLPKPSYELFNFLARNLQYPDSAREAGIEGRVIMGFIVDSLGTIRNIHVVKGVSADIDAEAYRVIGLLPPWQPGKQDDKPANLSFTMPLQFKLE